MKHTKANMWATSEPLVKRRASTPIFTKAYVPSSATGNPTVHVQQRAYEARDTNRADKAIRRFSWERDE